MRAWVDSHCHLQLAGGDEHVERALAAGVAWMVCVGTDRETSAEAVALAERHPEVYAVVGLHPHEASKLTDERAAIETLVASPRCVGIGEAGFDLYYEHSPRAAQEDAFRWQIELAKSTDRPLVIHSRDAWDDTFRVLDAEGVPPRTIFHCFTGGPGEARLALDRGCYLSFSGIVSFKNASELRDAAALAPADRVLVETDSPFLTPEPYRGKENEPAYVVLVGAALARARSVEPDEIATLTSANAAAGVRRRAVTPTEIRELLAAHHLRPSKALGQHFLADPNTAARIVRLAEVVPGDRVVEIGPGIGSLTVGLLDAGAHVHTIELDRHLVPALEDVTAGRDIVLTVADALRVDWNAVLDDGRGWKLVANLPYNVATPIVMQILESAPMIGRMLVMVQREVGERLAAGVGDSGYGAVSVKVAYRAAANIVGRVPPTVFMPPPKVESALVSLVRRTAPTVDVPDPARLFALVNAGFATRRKMLRRALAGIVDADAFASAGIDSSARAETLTLDDWARLARAMA